MLYNQNVDKYKILEVDIMAKFSYQPKGVCSVQIDFEVEDGLSEMYTLQEVVTVIRKV